MTTDALIGWTGLIGLELLYNLPNAECYNSKNISDISGKSFNTVYFCGLPAEKWMINKSPENDKFNMLNIQRYLSSVTANKFILISTVDVLDTSIEQDETGSVYSTHHYGVHRREMEIWVEKHFTNTYILRLPGLFGKGLKKNIIYDLLFNNQVENICLESKFQWYSIKNLFNNINYCITNNIHLIQFVSEPISVKDIVNNFFPELKYKCRGKNKVEYKLKTKHVLGYEFYWKSRFEIFNDLSDYILYEKQIQSLPFTVAVSNIGWDDTNFTDVNKILSRYRVHNLEVALTKFNSWDTLTEDTLLPIKNRDIKYVSCQSILYQTGINIFEEPEKFIEHYKKVAKLCSYLDIKNIVFGSPNQRHMNEKDESYILPYFKELGDISKENNLIFCIEPNSKKYGCTWLTNVCDTLDFIKKINHDNIKLNLDTGNYSMENDTFIFDDETIKYIGNIQVSRDFLYPLTTMSEEARKSTIKLLNNVMHYNGVISLEMRDTSFYDIVKSIDIFNNILINI